MYIFGFLKWFNPARMYNPAMMKSKINFVIAKNTEIRRKIVSNSIIRNGTEGQKTASLTDLILAYL